MALALSAIVLLPLASVFYGAEGANADNREYGDAIAIANGQLAQASGVTYADLGLYEHPSGTNCNVPLTIPGYNGQPAVDLGECPPSGTSAQIQPTSTPQQVGSVIYTASNYVVWVNGSGGDSCAYKQVYSVVSWNEGGNAARATQSILVYPGGLGNYTGSQCLNFIVSTTLGLTTASVASGGFPGSLGCPCQVRTSCRAPRWQRCRATTSPCPKRRRAPVPRLSTSVRHRQPPRYPRSCRPSSHRAGRSGR